LKLVQRIKERFKIPLVLKGIACAEDGTGWQHGVEAFTSNHGGRQLIAAFRSTRCRRWGAWRPRAGNDHLDGESCAARTC
jgi:hypothetical protein